MTRDRNACLALFADAREKGLMVLKHGGERAHYLTPEEAEEWIGNMASSSDSTEVKPGYLYHDAVEMWSMVHPLACWGHRRAVEKEHSMRDERERIILGMVKEGNPPVTGEMWEMSQDPERYLTGHIEWRAKQHEKYRQKTKELAERYGWPI